jgi:cell division protein FtsA
VSTDRPLVGIDVGSSAVSVVVGSLEEDQLVVYGCGHARHDGARKGVIAKLDEVSEAVRVAAEEAEAMASLPVEMAAVGLGGTPIQGNPATASVPVTGRGDTVTGDDVHRALAACAQVSIPRDYRVLDIIPCGFALDGHDGMEYPVGMPGRRLDASAYVLYSNRIHAETVEQAVNRAAVAVQQLAFEPLAAAEAVLDDDERDLGCLLLDIGFATTEWVLLADESLAAGGSVPVGGRHFTSDLAAMLKTTTAAAEDTKRSIGAAIHRDSLDEEAIEVPALGGDGNQVHPASFVAEVLVERARDLFISVHRVLVERGLDRAPRAGVVLTGGGSLLEGLVVEAESIFGHRVRLGSPRALAGLTEPVSGPEWAVACGLIRLQGRKKDHTMEGHRHRSGILTWLRNAFGDFFSWEVDHDRV